MSRRLRVLEVLEATVGGTRRHLISILAGIDRDHFDLEVAAPGVRQGNVTDDSFQSDVRDLAIPFHLVNLRRDIHPWVDLRASVSLYRLLRQGSYDVVHLHSSKAGFVGRFAARGAGIPTVYTPNGFYFLQADQSSLKRRLFLELEKIAGHATDCLIAVSQSECESAIETKLINPNKIRVIPNAIQQEVFQPDPLLSHRMRTELGISASQFVIGVVSRYIPQKDPLTIVETAKNVVQRDPNVLFVWCGEGEMRAQTEQRTRDLGIYDRFLFLGFRKDVKAVMQTFDLYLLTSIFEGLPYTLLETMSMGIPIVATSVVGTKDVVEHGETGLLLPCKRADLLASAILDLIAKPTLRAELSKNGKQAVHAKFNLDAMLRDIESVYLDLSRGFRSSRLPR